MKEGRYRKAIFVVVYARDKDKIYYLILKRRHHWRGWEFPKGGINPGENKKHAAGREAIEETGLIPIKIKKFNYSGKYLYKKKFMDRKGLTGQTFSLYAARVKNGKVKIDKKEHKGYKWFGFDEAIRKVRFVNQKKSLRIVNNWLKNEF